MMDNPPISFVNFCYRNYITIAFAKNVHIPETWNIQNQTWYHCLIKNCDAKTLSIVFFNDAYQLIDTLIAYDDINSGRIFVKVPMEV